MKKLLILFSLLAWMPYSFSKDATDWETFTQYVARFGYASHELIQNAKGKKLSEQQKDIIEYLAQSAKQAIAFITDDNEQEAVKHFGNYIFKTCSVCRLHGFPEHIATISRPERISLIGKAVAAFESYANGMFKDGLLKRGLNSLFYNYFTTRFVPGTLKWVGGPLLTIMAYRKMGKTKEVNWFDILTGKKGNPLLQFLIGLKDRYLDPQMLKFLLPIPVCYGTAKLIARLQQDEYMKRQTEKQKNSLLDFEKEKVQIQKEEKNWILGTHEDGLRQITEYLHNSDTWWRPQIPGTRGALVVRISSDPITTPIFSPILSHLGQCSSAQISFLDLSYREKAQAIVAKAIEHAQKHPLRSFVIVIDSIDCIQPHSKAHKHLKEIVFDAKRNPYLNILVVGTTNSREAVPQEIRMLFTQTVQF